MSNVQVSWRVYITIKYSNNARDRNGENLKCLRGLVAYVYVIKSVDICVGSLENTQSID